VPVSADPSQPRRGSTRPLRRSLCWRETLHALFPGAASELSTKRLCCPLHRVSAEQGQGSRPGILQLAPVALPTSNKRKAPLPISGERIRLSTQSIARRGGNQPSTLQRRRDGNRLSRSTERLQTAGRLLAPASGPQGGRAGDWRHCVLRRLSSPESSGPGTAAPGGFPEFVEA